MNINFFQKLCGALALCIGLASCKPAPGVKVSGSPIPNSNGWLVEVSLSGESDHMAIQYFNLAMFADSIPNGGHSSGSTAAEGGSIISEKWEGCESLDLFWDRRDLVTFNNHNYDLRAGRLFIANYNTTSKSWQLSQESLAKILSDFSSRTGKQKK